jgi:TonB family protein
MHSLLAIAFVLASFGATADSLRTDKHLVKIDAQSRQYNIQIFDAESRSPVAHLKVVAQGDDPAEAETTAGNTRYHVRIFPHGTSYLVVFTADDGAGGIDTMRAGFTQRIAQDAKPSAEPMRGGRDVEEPKVLRRVEPVYTETARAAGAAGTVVLEVLIDRSGFVRNAKVVKSMGYGLDESAADAVQQWQFEPSAHGRERVEVLHEVTIDFKP